jgi:hypothetical protein
MAKPRKAARRLRDAAFNMEEPLNHAIDIVEAIDLMGHGMIGQGNQDHGQPLATMAGLAIDHLQFVKKYWLKMVKAQG